MQKVILKIHSFVDIITNSSSEIYVEATDNTVKNVKLLVNSLLRQAESKLTCDDLFEITLSETEESDDYPTVDLIVTPKSQDPNVVIASKILSDLTGIFNMESTYNG